MWKGHRPKNLRPFLLSWTFCETTSTISHADLMRSNVSSGIRGISGGVGGLIDWCAGKLLPRTTACQTHHLWCLPWVPCTIHSISRHGGPSARGFGAPHHSGGLDNRVNLWYLIRQLRTEHTDPTGRAVDRHRRSAGPSGPGWRRDPRQPQDIVQVQFSNVLGVRPPIAVSRGGKAGKRGGFRAVITAPTAARNCLT